MNMKQRASFVIRENPLMFLFKERLFKYYCGRDPREMAVLMRNWRGPVWDVGASVGKYSTVLAKANQDHLVYCFEPNFNSLYYLAYRTCKLPNVCIVPMALTLTEPVMSGSYNTNFNARPTGPDVITMQLCDAIDELGTPAFIKLDIEGGEYDLLKYEPSALRDTAMLVEWHGPIPKLDHWNSKQITNRHVLYTPKQ